MTRPAIQSHVLRPRQLLRLLVEHEVAFVVIGGFALGAHHAERATKDIDIVPDPAPDNLERLIDALDSVNATPTGLEEFDRAEWPVEFDLPGLLHGGNWILMTDLGRVDVLQCVPGVDGFHELNRTAVDIDFPDVGLVWFAGLDQLISMKRAAGRQQDLLDIERLREANPDA